MKSRHRRRKSRDYEKARRHKRNGWTGPDALIDFLSHLRPQLEPTDTGGTGRQQTQD